MPIPGGLGEPLASELPVALARCRIARVIHARAINHILPRLSGLLMPDYTHILARCWAHFQNRDTLQVL